MVYLLLGNGFEEVEALTQVDYLRRAGIEVFTVGLNGKRITGGHGITVEADIEITDAILKQDADMIILPGGLGGVSEMRNSDLARALLRRAHERGAYLAAICAAPVLLAEMGLLRGKKAVCYPSLTGELKAGGAILSDAGVVIDVTVITAKAAGMSEQFALALIGLLRGESAAQKVKDDICSV